MDTKPLAARALLPMAVSSRLSEGHQASSTSAPPTSLTLDSVLSSRLPLIVLKLALPVMTEPLTMRLAGGAAALVTEAGRTNQLVSTMVPAAAMRSVRERRIADVLTFLL